MPRKKLCGGGVTPKVLKLLDFEFPRELVESTPKSARIHVGKQCFKFHSTSPLVYMTSRDKFDSFLVDKAKEAGAEFRDGIMVQTLIGHEGSIEAKTTNSSFEAKMVIGCDGTGGPTARTAGLYTRWEPDGVAYAIESEVPFRREGVREFMGPEEYFDVYFGVSPAGYGWVFPKDDHLTVGVGCRMSNLRNGRELFNKFIETIPELSDHEIPSPEAHPIPLGGAIDVPIVADRILLAGDSAGFAEPHIGEGIYFATLGGQIAATVAAEACISGQFDTDSLSAYTRRCDTAFGVDFAAALRLAKGSYLENYDMDRLARFFFSNPRFHDFMIGLMTGTVRFRDAQSKLAIPYLKYRLAQLGLPIQP